MTARLVHLLYRRKLLFCLPVIVGLSAGILWSTAAEPPRYEAVANIWVDRPTAATGSSFTDYNQYISPAQNQAGAMRELLNTNLVRERLLNRLRQDPETARGTSLLTPYDVRVNALFMPRGTHILTISYRDDIPEVAVAMVDAILKEYTALYLAQIQERAVVTKQFYEEQVRFARSTLEDATTKVREYVNVRPGVLSSPMSGSPLSSSPSLPLTSVGLLSLSGATDTTFQRLLAAEDTAAKDYEQIQGRYADSQIAASAAARGTPNFQIVDEARLTERALLPSTRELLVKPALGVILGMILSTTLFLLYWRLDRYVWLPTDLELIGVTAPVMTLPSLYSRQYDWPKSFVRLTAGIRNGLRPAPLLGSNIDGAPLQGVADVEP